MFSNFRFELSFKNISQLEDKLIFCKRNGITNINIPCKGIIKKEFLNSIIQYIKNNHAEFNVVYHYSLFHQYTINKERSYENFVDFRNNCILDDKYQILLVSGSRKKKNFDVIDVLNHLENDANKKFKLGIAYNPYLNKHFNNPIERDRYKKKISSGLVNSTWLQFGTDIKLLENEVNFLRKEKNYKINNLFGSLLIPSRQFLARFKFRPWKEVYIADKYINSLDKFNAFTKDLLKFYIDNNVTPVIETDFTSIEKLEKISNLFNFK